MPIRSRAIGSFWVLALLLWAVQGAFAKDLVWRVKSSTATVYLAGSVHVLGLMNYPLPFSLDEAYASCNQIGFEIDLDAASAASFAPYIVSKATNASGKKLSDFLTPDAYAGLKDSAVAHGQKATFLDPYRPWFADSLLGSWLAQDAGLSEIYGVDRYYFDQAKLDLIPRFYLETPKFQIDTLASISDAEMGKALAADLAGGVPALEELVDQWSASNLEAFEAAVSDMQTRLPESYQAILYNRNTNWVTQIEGLLKTNKVSLLIAGAAHFVGTNGVVELLRKRNHIVQQLPLTPAGISRVQATIQTASGDAVSVDVDDALEVVEALPLTLQATLVGEAPIRSQWYKNGIKIPGETNSFLRFPSLTSANSGDYQLTVSNEVILTYGLPISLRVSSPMAATLDVSPTLDSFQLGVSGSPFGFYRIESLDTLRTNSWQFFTNVLVSGAAGLGTAIPIAPADQWRFFRAVYSSP